MQAIPFRAPDPPSTGEPFEEVLEYRISARPRSKFKTVIDAKALFGAGEGRSRIVTRRRPAGSDGAAFELEVEHGLAQLTVEEQLTCTTEGGLCCDRFVRRVVNQIVHDLVANAANFKRRLVSVNPFAKMVNVIVFGPVARGRQCLPITTS